MIVLIQGNFNETGSYGRINNALAYYLQLLRPQWRVCGDSWDGPLPEKVSSWDRANANPDVVIRQFWPPQFRHWPQGAIKILIQPWEYGTVPREWVESIDDVDWIWVPSSFVKEEWIQSGVPPSKIRVIPNGVKTVLPELPIREPSPFRFLFIGGPIYRKGIDLVFEGFSRAFPEPDPNVQLVIKATGQKTFYQGQDLLNDLLDKYAKWRDNVVVLAEFLTDDDLTSLIDSAHVLIHPYRGEGFGLPVLEAMARGTLVVTTDVGGASDFANDKTAIVVPSGVNLQSNFIGRMPLSGPGYLREPSVQALADHLRIVYEKYQNYQPLRENALRVARRYLWDRCAGMVLEQIDARGSMPRDRYEEAAEAVDQWKKNTTLENSLHLVSKLLAIGDHQSARLVHMGSLLFHDKRFSEIGQTLANLAALSPDLWIKGYFRWQIKQAILTPNVTSSHPFDEKSFLNHLSVITTKPLRTTEVDSWHGHIPFAYLLTRLAEPRVFVELGTHKGDSYFSFCQAVREFGLGTRCYAVDTWTGDQHAGYYGESIFFEVANYNALMYPDISTLIRSTFDQALDQFCEGSIDLLHIDGEHTYSAAKKDFESWLPKMSSQGVILFHDIYEFDNGFGAWKLWEELKCQYPFIEFPHSHGLGVLFTGSEYAEQVTSLIRMPAQDLEGLRGLIRHSAKGITPETPLVSIVIPQYGHADMTIDCVYSLLVNVIKPRMEIIIIDDCSEDNSLQIVSQRFENYPHITVCKNRDNMGFAASCNRGAAVARGEHIVFLNNDTISTSDWLSPMLKVIMNTPEVGIVGAKILYPDGRLQHSGVNFQNAGYFPLDPFTRGWNEEGHRYSEPEELPAVIGACLMIKQDLFNTIEGFDETYFMSYEDVDLCLKVISRGLKVWYEPTAIVIHREGASRNVPERVVRDRDNAYYFNAKWLATDLFSLKFGMKLPDAARRNVVFVVPGDSGLHDSWQMIQQIGASLMEGDQVVCEVAKNSIDAVRELFRHLERNNPAVFSTIQENEIPGHPSNILTIRWDAQGGSRVTGEWLDAARSLTDSRMYVSLLEFQSEEKT